MGKAKKISLKIRKDIWERDNYKCTYCEIDLPKKRGPYLTVDHVLPKKQGGGDEPSNLTTACDQCNKDKGHLLLTQFIRAFEIKITPSIMRFL